MVLNIDDVNEARARFPITLYMYELGQIMAKIYYALVARERVILCDGGQTGFEQSSQEVLEGLPQSVSMKSYAVSRHVYHIMVSDGLRYLCVADRVFDRQIAFAFLREMEHQLISTGLKERANYIGPYGLRHEFGSHRIVPLLEQYSSHDRISRLQDKVSEVTDIMTDNIEKVIRKSANLEDLTDRTTLLADSGTDFRHRKKPKNTNRTAKFRAVIIILIVLVIILLLLIVAGAILAGLKLTGHLNRT